MKLDEETMKRTDYLTETLRTEKSTQLEIYHQMLLQLERLGLCRAVYHRLGLVLLGDNLGHE